MESVSRSSKVFEDDDDDEEFGKREGSFHKELTLTIDGRSIDQTASAPRSKHSATEQRRRSKINDSKFYFCCSYGFGIIFTYSLFQVLRGLLPNSEQKRDKASFLLEVIEYIRFLHEKVQKYESIYPGWIDENTKLLAWNNHQDSGDNIGDASIIKNGSAPGFVLSEADNLASHFQWMRASNPGDCAISNDMLDELTIDEGTISVSCAYSQGLLNNLSEALQNSGIDLSRASVSVQINLGRKSGGRSSKPSLSSKECLESMGGDESEGGKRQKSNRG
ncbi:transcription factor BIM2 isoform X3 [Dendrobium catenatum]|uniref:transcription factor BIM2 isoform X3 n=1 Tax=Dendrobium catenatum TaxID=906689 RepID=UPI00109FC6B8|nr:transcription factor BIM2 isoform X3 [Dendrobium catenatum]